MYSPPNCSYRTSRRRGIGRVDLIVLILMFAIVTSIVIPGIYVTWQAYVELSCKNNLREIGSAYRGFVNANKGDARSLHRYQPGWMKEIKGYVTPSSGWITQIRKYLKTDTSVFTCLNEEQPSGKRWPEAKIFHRESGGGGDTYLRSIPLSDSTVRMRVSKTFHCPPGVALEMEAGGFNYRTGKIDFDWKHLVITVQHQRDGSVKLTAVSAIDSPYYFDLYDGYGQLLVYDFGPKPYSNDTYTFPPDAPGLGSFSYSMNSAARAFSTEEDGNKILVAEYKKPVCNVVDMLIGNRQLFATDYWPNDCAPRHNGMLNVLFMNGAVKTLSPQDINPGRPALAKEYWLPTAYQPDVP